LLLADENWENDESSSDEGTEIVQVIPVPRSLEGIVRDGTDQDDSIRALPILNDVSDDAKNKISIRAFREPKATTKDVSIMDENSFRILDDFYRNSTDILTVEMSKEVISGPEDLNERMFQSFLEMSDNYSEEMVDKKEGTSLPVKNTDSLTRSLADCQVSD
jgi:hypothetical protein